LLLRAARPEVVREIGKRSGARDANSSMDSTTSPVIRSHVTVDDRQLIGPDVPLEDLAGAARASTV